MLGDAVGISHIADTTGSIGADGKFSLTLAIVVDGSFVSILLLIFRLAPSADCSPIGPYFPANFCHRSTIVLYLIDGPFTHSLGVSHIRVCVYGCIGQV